MGEKGRGMPGVGKKPATQPPSAFTLAVFEFAFQLHCHTKLMGEIVLLLSSRQLEL